MTLLTILVLASMAVANCFVERRLLYPPIVFCSIWAADLALIGLSGDLFFPLSTESLIIFCCGGLAVSVGSALAIFFPLKTASRRETAETSSSIFKFFVAVVVCSAPFACIWIAQMASRFSAPNFFMAAYMAMIAAYEAGESSVLFGSLLTLSVIMAMIAFLERDRYQKAAFVAVVMGFMLSALTGQRAGVISLIFALVAIDWMKNRCMRWKSLSVMFVLLLAIFSILAVFVGKAGADPNASFSENVVPIAKGFALYAAGGIVGFDEVVRQPNIIPHNWQVSTFFLQTANKFGGHFEVPDLYANYLSVGPDLAGNVYTMYFAFFDLGYPLMMFFIMFIGFIVTLFYRKAIGGNRIAIVIYGFLFTALLLSPYDDNFFMGLNFSLKIFAVSWLVYNLPATWVRFQRHFANIRFEPSGQFPPSRSN
jgi:oligosaccharide repeat unit polymerase